MQWLNSKAKNLISRWTDPRRLLNDMLPKTEGIPKRLETTLLTLHNLLPQAVIGGSLTLGLLKVLNFSEHRRRTYMDLDISLTAPLTEKELKIICNLLKMKVVGVWDSYTDDESKKDGLLKKHLKNGKLVQIQGENIKIDFFINNYLPSRDIVMYKYKTSKNQEVLLRLTHPSIILGAKAQYMFDHRAMKRTKHFNDLRRLNYEDYISLLNTNLKCYNPFKGFIEDKNENKLHVYWDKRTTNQEEIQEQIDNNKLKFKFNE